METFKPLSYLLLRRRLNSKKLNFFSTAEVKVLNEFIGQERALTALDLGVGIKHQGYNLYAMGPAGIGKRSLIKIVLREKAAQDPVPNDWCYVHNFDDPEKPIAIQLPPGVGVGLKENIKVLINDLSTMMLSVFESDEYRDHMQEIMADFTKKHKSISKENSNNKDHNKITYLYKRRHVKEKKLQHRLTSKVVKPIIKKLKKKYIPYRQVIKFLQSLEEDIIFNVSNFIKTDETTNLIYFVSDSPLLTNYQVNLLVDNSKRKTAPVIFENNPSYSNLICRVEYTAQMGTTMTSFTLIKPGALHLANGGYLVIEARKLKKDKEAWEGLKRALYTRKIRIDPIENYIDTFRPVSLDPTPIPLNIKIILLGTRRMYYRLSNHDPDFNELFKVTVDFDEEIERNPKNINLFSRLIATISKKEGLKPLHVKAVAEIIDYCTRQAEDTEKISMYISTLFDLIIESDYWANVYKRKIIKQVDVRRAIKARIHRVDRVRELYYEDINRNFIVINTQNKIIGQVNCLSVVKVGRFLFGHPTRVTSTVRMGKAKLIDIQREIRMAGPIHSKASLTLINFLGSRYCKNYLFSLCASISFEQVYGSVDGDSASVGEVCALLSAIAEIPIKQSLAVTGSIDQYGVVQAVGGINEKIEGFFDICRKRTLNGKHGVLIPAVNVKNLMLKDEVVSACKLKMFSIYSIETIDDALLLLMDVPQAKSNNRLLKLKMINEKVEKKLEYFAHYAISKKKKNDVNTD